MIAPRVLALVALGGLTLGACHDRDGAASAPDAGADARAHTAAKTAADLAAADAASGRPLPRPVVAPPERRTQPAPSADGGMANGANPNL